MSFQLSPGVDKYKIFLVQRNELEGRLDPFFYVPELVELDRKIKSKTEFRLKDYCLSYSSGATPSKSIDEYYSTKDEGGVPFVRVQNLSTTGELNTEDLKYITKETHDNLLKRSQIREHDLLIKITGVGRMAVASVVPDGFEGNIKREGHNIRWGANGGTSSDRRRWPSRTNGTRHKLGAVSLPRLRGDPSPPSRSAVLNI